MPKLVLAQNLPFLYLNQYFNYEVLSSSEISVAEKTFDFNKLEITQEEKKTTINLMALQEWIVADSKLVFENAEKKSVGEIKVKKDKLLYKVLVPAAAESICVNSASIFSEIEFCKSVHKFDQPSAAPQVRVNGEVIDNRGVVVLKDKSDILSFTAILSAENTMLMKTKKRNVMPSSVKKNAADDFMTIQFKDQNLDAFNSWDEKINVDQSYVVLQLDPVISLRQDLYFNRPNLKSSPWNYTSTALKTNFVGKIVDDGLTTEVFGIFSGINGVSSTTTVSLNTDLGKGVRGTFRWPINAKFRGFLQGFIYQTLVINDSSNRVTNPSQVPYALTGGAEYQLWNRWSLLGQLGLRKDLFFKTDIASNVEISTGLNTEISVTPIWEIYRVSDAKWTADLGLSFLSGSASGSATSGYKYQLGTSYVRRFSLGQFSISGYYANRSQNSSANTLAEKIFYYGAGYHYSF